MSGTQNTQKLKHCDLKASCETGALIFAYNNSAFDYIAIAEVAAQLIRWHLQIPVTLVTDTSVVSAAFDSIIVDEYKGENRRVFRMPNETLTVEWKNRGRWRARELSPYNRTLLVDADYIVRTPYLKTVLDSSAEFACYKHAYDVMQKDKLASDALISRSSIEMWWATVVVWNKDSVLANTVFDLWQIVAEHWDYYAHLYSFKASVFRNDFALSIAVHLATGMHTAAHDSINIPHGLPSLSSTDTVLSATPSKLVVADDANRNAVYTDLHIMNKHAFTPKIIKELLDA